MKKYEAKAFEEGRAARAAGKPVTANPYGNILWEDRSLLMADAWLRGYGA